MNEESIEERVKIINIENFFLLLIITVLFVSININNTNKYYAKMGYDRIPKDVEDKIKKKALISAWIFLLAGIFFLYSAYKDYQKEKNSPRLNFTIAAALVFLAAAIRVYTLYKFKNVEISGSEDYAL